MSAAFEAHPDSELEPQVDALHKAAIAIGGATAVSGLGLIAAPRLVLCILGAGRSDPAPFLFRIIGMFMTVSGGLLADGARVASTHGESRAAVGDGGQDRCRDRGRAWRSLEAIR